MKIIKNILSCRVAAAWLAAKSVWPLTVDCCDCCCQVSKPRPQGLSRTRPREFTPVALAGRSLGAALAVITPESSHFSPRCSWLSVAAGPGESKQQHQQRLSSSSRFRNTRYAREQKWRRVERTIKWHPELRRICSTLHPKSLLMFSPLAFGTRLSKPLTDCHLVTSVCYFVIGLM